MVAIGQGVKVYLAPHFGRQDAVVVRVVDGGKQVINAKIVRTGRIARDLVYKTSLLAGERGYWIELPDGYVPGSEGH